MSSRGWSKHIPPKSLDLVDQILHANSLHRRFLEGAIEHASDEELNRLESYLEYCTARGLSAAYLSASYLTVVKDTLREQVYFMKHGRYRHDSFAAVQGDVYHNSDYMNRYMYGLAITSFLWPNHVELMRFFRQTLPTDQKGAYLEIGPGHGFYLMTAMQCSAFDAFLGIDVSQTSIEQTHEITRHFAPESGDRLRLECKDFLAAGDLRAGSFDAIVMGEVLEHVEQPGVFLERIEELASDDAHIFVTTCVNAPAIDHIYLWRSTDELEAMIEGSGLKIREALRVPYEGKTLAEATEQALAVNVAYVLEKVR